FEKEYPSDTIFLILGSDAFLDLVNWKEAKSIINHVHIVVNLRPGADISLIKTFSRLFFGNFTEQETDLEVDIVVSKIYERNQKSVYLNLVRQLEISSSYIRYRMERKEDISFLVPQTVIDVLKYNPKHR
ncbi:MAG: hypothetical protein HQK84_07620, partial [Nitrospinae bacterium]|nr:hypothetical protein [Nitrospinota bacterium]